MNLLSSSSTRTYRFVSAFHFKMLSVNEPSFVFQRVGGGCVPVSLVRHYNFETLISGTHVYMFELWLDQTARTLINCHNPAIVIKMGGSRNK